MENNSDKLLAGGSSASTGVLLSTLWTQSGYIYINGFSTGYQFNEYCPMDYSTGKRSITGCTNTAAAQIIHYYIEKFGLDLQLTLTAADEYTSEYNSNTVTITQSGTSAGTISFSQINSYLSYYDTTSGQDIAALNYACGVIQEAGYSSSATGTHWNEELFFRAGFDSANSVSVYGNSNVYWGSQGNISAAGFEVLIENLTAGKVVGTSYPGHALIIDGYNASNDTFHINFGWGNSSSTRWYTRAEINAKEYYHFYYDLGVDSDYSYTVNDTDVYGTGTLVRAVEVANGAKEENLIKFTSATADRNLTLLISYGKAVYTADTGLVKSNALKRTGIAVKRAFNLREIASFVARAEGVIICAKLFKVRCGNGAKRRVDLSVKIRITANDVNFRGIVNASVI